MTTLTEVMLEMQPTIADVIKAEKHKAYYEAIGWCYSFCCNALDEGKDIRKIQLPEIMEEAAKTLG
jgi:hypothetical protein